MSKYNYERYVLKHYCDNFENIENYEKAKADNFNGWDVHHRLETHTSDGERRLVDITREELKALDMYYHRPASELIFLTKKEHQLLGKPSKGYHHSEETKKRLSEANKGKHRSEEIKNKIGEANRGKHRSEEAKKKMSDSIKEHMAKIKDAYKQYKLSGGSIKWNEFQHMFKDKY